LGERSTTCATPFQSLSTSSPDLGSVELAKRPMLIDNRRGAKQAALGARRAAHARGGGETDEWGRWTAAAPTNTKEGGGGGGGGVEEPVVSPLGAVRMLRPGRAGRRAGGTGTGTFRVSEKKGARRGAA
jgi:hypothetical protein